MKSHKGGEIFVSFKVIEFNNKVHNIRLKKEK